MVMLFRDSLAEEGELAIAKKYFDVYRNRSEIPRNSTVIGRYSVLPYYQELEYDLQSKGCCLINSYQQHRWIADFEYYDVVKDYTFETWDDNSFYRAEHDGPFVVKGKTNSRKMNWDTMMFARNKGDALRVASTLKSDGLICSQDIIYRKYEPLVTYEIGLNGLPFTNEWRFFYHGKKRLSHGYYWTLCDSRGVCECIDLADEIAGIVSEHVNFFVLDLAQTVSGEWKLVEINDGQMSGLSDNDADVLYKELSDS